MDFFLKNGWDSYGSALGFDDGCALGSFDGDTLGALEG